MSKSIHKELEINIASIKKQYKIYIESGCLTRVSKYINKDKYSAIFIITDTNVAALYLEKFKNGLKGIKIAEHIFAAGEENKNLDTVSQIYASMIKAGMDRKTLIVNLGGGVVTDMGGLVAATYMRGVDFINISTTVEGMVDACIGGKVGVNFQDYKNYVGAFVHPKMIFMDIDTLSTLDEREYIAGFAEILKHGLIKDREYFNYCTAKHPRDFTTAEMIEIIYRSCEIKAWVVENDEKENGLRKILNFGHTIGHAIEKLSFQTDSRILHGEAVAVGMVAAAKISQLMNFISEKDYLFIKAAIKNSGLPVVSPIKNKKMILETAKSDKKAQKGSINWSLLKNIGTANWDQQVDEGLVAQAVDYILE